MLSELHKLSKLIWQKEKKMLRLQIMKIFFYSAVLLLLLLQNILPKYLPATCSQTVTFGLFRLREQWKDQCSLHTG